MTPCGPLPATQGNDLVKVVYGSLEEPLRSLVREQARAFIGKHIFDPMTETPLDERRGHILLGEDGDVLFVTNDESLRKRSSWPHLRKHTASRYIMAGIR